ncbi:MAG: response regulator [Nitrososphaeraceae archaeon]|nr:response regulator [Nitrososphaeraceae archaeon]
MITSNAKSIVVVVDERDIVNQIRRSLEAMDGLKVYTFTDPFAALEHFNSCCKDHHILISDIRMPGMNGYTAQQIEYKIILFAISVNGTTTIRMTYSLKSISGFLIRCIKSDNCMNALRFGRQELHKFMFGVIIL